MSQIVITIEEGKTSISITSDDGVNVQLPTGMKRLKWFHHSVGFGDRLSRVRKRSRHTQQFLASELGVGQPSIVDWEKGRSYPKQNRIETIAKLCGTTPEYLITGEEEPGHG